MRSIKLLLFNEVKGQALLDRFGNYPEHVRAAADAVRWLMVCWNSYTRLSWEQRMRTRLSELRGASVGLGSWCSSEQGTAHAYETK